MSRVSILEDKQWKFKEDLYDLKNNIISCSKCGHLIFKNTAIKGESKIVLDKDDEEIIKEQYYHPNCH